ncbi:MAG: hypothetical protein ACRC80_32320, partial [Waterburya sp.]
QHNWQGLSTGIWVHSGLLSAFISWAEKAKRQNWTKYLVPDLKFNEIHEASISFYPWFINNSSIEEIYIHQATGFVTTAQIIETGYKGIDDLVSNVQFILALEQVRQELNNGWEINEQDYTPSEGIFWSYRELLKLIKIGEREVLFIHPDVFQIYTNNKHIPEIIKYYQRQQQNQCYLTYIEASSFLTSKENLRAIAPENCHTQIWHTPKHLALRITDKNYHWQFTIDLVTGKVYILPELLKLYDWETDKELQAARQEDFMTNFDAATNSVETSILKGIPLKIFELRTLGYRDEYYMMFDFEGKEHQVIIPEKFAKALKETIINCCKLSDTENPLEQLCKLGYVNPIKNEIVAIDPDIRVIRFGNTSVRQRMSDGFVNANDLARTCSLDLAEWLKLDKTWNFFAAMARKRAVNIASEKNMTSKSSTRVVKAFPSLIERKMGS